MRARSPAILLAILIPASRQARTICLNLQDVPFTADIEQIAGSARFWLDLLAQMVNMRFNQLTGFEIGRFIALGTPYQLRIRQHLTGVFGQTQKQAELGWGQVQRTTIQGCGLVPRIQGERPNGKNPACRFG